MRKYILALALLMAAATAQADIKYIPASFQSASLLDMAAKGTDLGKKNMTGSLTDFAGTHDDDAIPSGLIRITFKNLANEDIEGKMHASVNPGFVNKTEYRKNPKTGAMEYWVQVDPGRDLTLTLTMDGGNTVRVPGLSVESERIYTMGMESDEQVAVTINTTVSNTKVTFDGIEVGIANPNEPVRIPRASLGKHKIMGKAKANEEFMDVEVSKVTNAFTLDMLPKFNIEFVSNEPGVQLYEDDMLIGTMPLQNVKVSQGPHAYTVRKMGYPDVPHNVNVSANGRIDLPIHKVKVIDFYATSSNSRVNGATVYVNGEDRGQTPLQLPLSFGKYEIAMSYAGKNKKGSLKVNDGTPNDYTINLPAAHHRYNPFAIDYRKRNWGLEVGYVQKTFKVTEGNRSQSQGWWPDSKNMSGVQFGIPIQPFWGPGIGFKTGLYFEFYYTKSKLEEEGSIQEWDLYVPVDLQFRLPLGEEMSIYLSGGIGFDYGLDVHQKIDDESIKLDYDEDINVDRFQYSAEFGAGFQYKALQIGFNYQIGLKDNKRMHEGASDVTCKVNKLSARIAAVF